MFHSQDLKIYNKRKADFEENEEAVLMSVKNDYVIYIM